MKAARTVPSTREQPAAVTKQIVPRHLDMSSGAPSRLKTLREAAAIAVIGHCCFPVALFGFKAGGTHHVHCGDGGESGEGEDGVAFFLAVLANSCRDRRDIRHVARDPAPNPWRRVIARQNRHSG